MYKLHHLFTILFLLLYHSINAQSQYRFSFMVNSGVSVPLGKLSASGAHPATGAAKAGYMVGLEGVYRVNKYIGIGTILSRASYVRNHTGLADQIAAQTRISIRSVFAKPYQLYHTLGGIYLYLFQSRYVTLTGKAMLGGSILSAPQIDALTTDGKSIIRRKGVGSAITYLIGTVATVPLKHRFTASLQIDYFRSKPQYIVSYQGSYRGNYRYNEIIYGLYCTAGLTVHF